VASTGEGSVGRGKKCEVKVSGLAEGFRVTFGGEGGQMGIVIEVDGAVDLIAKETIFGIKSQGPSSNILDM
jgi:hypothetical protein